MTEQSFTLLMWSVELEMKADLCFMHTSVVCRIKGVTQTNMGVIGNWVDWTLYIKMLDWLSSEEVPVSLDICAFILQENYLPGVMAAHFSVGVVDDTVLVISGK